MGNYMESELEVLLNYNVEAVWDVVTNISEYGWRSDVSKIEKNQDGSWTEYDVHGNQTYFFDAEDKAYQSYSFRMKNKLFSGKWSAVFQSESTGKTILHMTERIQIKNPVMRLIAKFAWNLQGIQQTYISDLKKKLEEIN